MVTYILYQIATVSANNDIEVGKLISTAIDKVGLKGVVHIESSKTGDTYIETVEGMQFDRGYKSPYFVTDNNTMTSVLENPAILMIDGKLNSVKELLPILEAVGSQGRSLLIIADDIDNEALATLIVNKMRGTLAVCAVKSPVCAVKSPFHMVFELYLFGFVAPQFSFQWLQLLHL